MNLANLKAANKDLLHAKMGIPQRQQISMGELMSAKKKPKALGKPAKAKPPVDEDDEDED